MPYVLTRCITPTGTTVWFPRFTPLSDPLDTGGYDRKTLPLSGSGVYDPNGNERAPRGLRRLTRQGRLREQSKTAIGDAFDALAVASGLRCAVWRQNEVGDRADWITAGVMVDAGGRDPIQLVRQEDGWWTLDVPIILELQDPCWHGTRHGTVKTPLIDPGDATSGPALDSAIPLDDVADTTTLATSPQTIAVTNDGNMPVDDGVLTLLAGSADITAFGFTCGKAKCAWTGTLKAGQVLVIDSGNGIVASQTGLTSGAAAGATALAVTNAAGTGWATGGRIRIVLDDGTIHEATITSLGGTTTVNISPGLPGAAASGREVWAAAYSGFSRDATLHSIAPWLRFAAGSNSLIVTKTGGSTNSTLTRSFYDGWS